MSAITTPLATPIHAQPWATPLMYASIGAAVAMVVCTLLMWRMYTDLRLLHGRRRAISTRQRRRREQLMKDPAARLDPPTPISTDDEPAAMAPTAQADTETVPPNTEPATVSDTDTTLAVYEPLTLPDAVAQSADQGPGDAWFDGARLEEADADSDPFAAMRHSSPNDPFNTHEAAWHEVSRQLQDELGEVAAPEPAPLETRVDAPAVDLSRPESVSFPAAPTPPKPTRAQRRAKDAAERERRRLERRAAKLGLTTEEEAPTPYRWTASEGYEPVESDQPRLDHLPYDLPEPIAPR